MSEEVNSGGGSLEFSRDLDDAKRPCSHSDSHTALRPTCNSFQHVQTKSLTSISIAVLSSVSTFRPWHYSSSWKFLKIWNSRFWVFVKENLECCLSILSSAISASFSIIIRLDPVTQTRHFAYSPRYFNQIFTNCNDPKYPKRYIKPRHKPQMGLWLALLNISSKLPANRSLALHPWFAFFTFDPSTLKLSNLFTFSILWFFS